MGRRVGESKASPSYFPERDKVYASHGYIPSFQMLYYFRSDVILLSDGSYITSLRMLLYFLQEVEVFSLKSRGISERK